jgi:hypothetical protein
MLDIFLVVINMKNHNPDYDIDRLFYYLEEDTFVLGWLDQLEYL